MGLPVVPPVQPMLAKLTAELPEGAYGYEPKWDGFRCLVFRDHDVVDLRSRKQSGLGRYFPELVAAALTVGRRRFVVDGEIVVTTDRGFDFEALLRRIHPAATHVERMVRRSPASFIAFDVLAIDDDDLRPEPFLIRRRRLEELFAQVPPPLFVTPLALDRADAQRWLAQPLVGIDGVVAKPLELDYQPGKRAMLKVKRERSADCVVAGCRLLPGRPAVSSLLLGLYDDQANLHHVGVAGSFTDARRRQLLDEVGDYVVDLEDHPWRGGFALEGGSIGRLPGSAGRWKPGMDQDWLALRPELVCEVGYNQLDGRRFRHPARFVRWRPDREPGSCRLHQLDEPQASSVELVGGRPDRGGG